MRSRLFPAFLVVLALCAGVACEQRSESVEAEPSPADAPPAVYTVRGEVVRLPEQAGDEMQIRHEAIDDFRGVDGTVLGMNAMTMSFPVADGVPLSGVSAGDPVEFTMEVAWEATPPYRLTAIRALPPETELEFRRAEP